MDLKEEINYALKWAEEFQSFKDGYDFINYVHDYISDLWEIDKLKESKNLYFYKSYSRLELTILGFSFVMINNMNEVIISKSHYGIEEVIGRYFVFEGKYQIKEKKVKYFHPKYIDVFLEEAFKQFYSISKKMRDTEYYIEG